MTKTRLLRPAWLVLYLIAFHFSVNAQTGNISGTVTDASRNSNLSGVLVHVEGQALQTVTDESGRYLLQGIRAGKVILSASYLGLETATQEITVRANETVSWDPVLKVPPQTYSVDVNADGDEGQA